MHKFSADILYQIVDCAAGSTLPHLRSALNTSTNMLAGLLERTIGYVSLFYHSGVHINDSLRAIYIFMTKALQNLRENCGLGSYSNSITLSYVTYTRSVQCKVWHAPGATLA